MEPKCTECVTHPPLRASGWKEPPYICPVCGEFYDKDFKRVEGPKEKKKASQFDWYSVGFKEQGTDLKLRISKVIYPYGIIPRS